MKIPIAKTNLLTNEIESVLEPLKSGWLVQGPKVKEFEEKWSNFTNSKYSIAVTSCTSAMHLSLAAIGFKAGDEAIVPAFTWISTANVVEHLGGKVVFCDIDINNFNIDLSKIEEKITDRTKVILPVHLFGLSVDMNRLMEIAKRNNLKVIEDAACGFGSTFNGQHVGTFGDTGCFSFHPRKSITTGEGGMITTQSEDLAIRLKRLRDHGAELSDLQRHLGPKPFLLSDHTDAGFNQRMTDIQGALGSAQMERAKEIIEERRLLAKNYNKSFSKLKWLVTPSEINPFFHSYQSYPCLFKPENTNNISEINKKRNGFMELLEQKGISTRPATHAVHMLSFYKFKYSIQDKDFPNALFANNCSISLPLYNGMSREEQSYVIEKVTESQF